METKKISAPGIDFNNTKNETIKLIQDWHLPQAYLAEKIGMSKSYFCQKMKSGKFSAQEFRKLRNQLAVLSADISKLDVWDPLRWPLDHDNKAFRTLTVEKLKDTDI